MFISKDKTLEREQYYIDLIKPDYNVCKIAGSQYGSLRSDDFKKRCRENMLGKEPWNKGKHSMTEEHKAKMDFGRRHGKKRVMTKKGKESQIMKLSKPVIQYDCNMVFIKEWSSLKDVSKNLPCSYSKISEHVNGKASHKTFKNFIWVLKVYLDQML
jgi:group I intron endonuclease